jgi:hypothetical protein
MSDLKNKYCTVNIDGKEYGMICTLNVIDDIQDKFGCGIESLDLMLNDPRQQMKVIKYLLAEMINEAADCKADENGEAADHVTERYIGRHIVGFEAMAGLMGAISECISGGLPEVDEEENPQMGQQSKD